MHQKMNNALAVYNLFPRLFQSIDDWTAQTDHIARMGFNAIFVNPFHLTGGSRSLYAIADYYRLNPEFIKKGADDTNFSPLKRFLSAASNKGISVIMDLVINHTANESNLVTEHPRWFKHDGGGNLIHPYAINPADPSHITVWGDLAEIDYFNNTEFDSLRAYWDAMIDFYQKLGFHGFRCDAAYKVPATMWQPLIKSAKARKVDTFFLAETLGCTLDQVKALSSCGFDYFFNSVKWWNFEGAWSIDQHTQFKYIAPSIGFPESHDTLRIASEPPGTIEWQKNRYTMAALYSKGLLMPIGYEFGAIQKLDVVNSKPDDNEPGKWDIGNWIAKVNSYKLSNCELCQEGNWESVWEYDDHVLFLMRTSDDGSSSTGLLVNKDWYNPTTIEKKRFPWQFGRYNNSIRIFDSPENKKALEENITLSPSEIILFTD